MIFSGLHGHKAARNAKSRLPSITADDQFLRMTTLYDGTSGANAVLRAKALDREGYSLEQREHDNILVQAL